MKNRPRPSVWARSAKMGPADVEGYHPTGRRVNEFGEETGAERMVAMLVRKLRGEPYVSELVVPQFDRVPPAPPLPDLSRALLGIVTTSGIVRAGNPERMESWRATRWARYPLAGLMALSPEAFTCVHGGYDNRHIRADPHRAVPLDVLRKYVADGRIGRLHETLYSIVGNVMPVERARRLGREVAEELRDAGVQAVLLTATCGTCNRCGATIAKEIERVGIPVAFFSAIPAISLNVGAYRVVPGRAVPYVLGDPHLTPEHERALRRQQVLAGLQSLCTTTTAPTLLELAGLPRDSGMQGRSLVPVFRNQTRDWRSSFLVEYFSDTVFPRIRNMGYSAVRTTRHKYIEYRELEPQLLPDLLDGRVSFTIDSLPAHLPYIKSGRLRALGVARQNSHDMEPNVRCDHFAVLTHSQVKCGFFDLWFEQIATRHPSQVAALERVGPQSQFIKIGSAIQLCEKALSRLLIIEQNLLDVYLLCGTGHIRKDFVTHPGCFGGALQRGPKGLLIVTMLCLPL